MVDTFNNPDFLHIALTMGMAVRSLAQGHIGLVAEREVSCRLIGAPPSALMRESVVPQRPARWGG